ncbi:MAG: ABC transporter ATP-binding protein, partial [Gemmatimonadales bacterium]
MLEVRNLRHAYAGRDVLHIDTLTLPAGTVTALVGPNGSGKSTLLRLLAFVERPVSGGITFRGTPIGTAAERRRARRRVTLVEQHPYLFRGSVRQNLLYALALHGWRGGGAAARADQVLEQMHLTALADRTADDLSAGEVQRTAVARALALEPEMLLLDEPLGQADRAAGTLLYHALAAERQRGTAVCIASHQLEDAYRWSDRLLSLADGRATPVVPENLFRTDLPTGPGPKTARVG